MFLFGPKSHESSGWVVATLEFFPHALSTLSYRHTLGTLLHFHNDNMELGEMSDFLSPFDCGRPGRNRTCNPRIRNPMLYPLELRALVRE